MLIFCDPAVDAGNEADGSTQFTLLLSPLQLLIHLQASDLLGHPLQVAPDPPYLLIPPLQLPVLLPKQTLEPLDLERLRRFYLL